MTGHTDIRKMTLPFLWGRTAAKIFSPSYNIEWDWRQGSYEHRALWPPFPTLLPAAIFSMTYYDSSLHIWSPVPKNCRRRWFSTIGGTAHPPLPGSDVADGTWKWGGGGCGDEKCCYCHMTGELVCTLVGEDQKSKGGTGDCPAKYQDTNCLVGK